MQTFCNSDSDLLRVFHFSVDVNQLQTFTHIALMTQCTDGSSVDLLTSLDQVGMKLAPLIFDLQKHDGLDNFMKLCNALRSEHLPAIPEKVVSKSDRCVVVFMVIGSILLYSALVVLLFSTIVLYCNCLLSRFIVV